LLGLIALSLLLIGRYTQWLTPLRPHLEVISAPFYWVTNIPSKIGLWFDDRFTAKQDLLEENQILRNQLLIHQGKLQQMATLAAENLRLRHLMNSSEILQDRILVGELIGISPDPKVHKVIINKGSDDGIYMGQPVLDEFGLMGQVVSVSAYTSQVLLITDNNHALPVQVNRNGLRTVAEGLGDLYQLRLRHVSSTMDIQEGDLLVSSGLGQRFPVGYPVARIESIVHDPGKSFATVVARPAAHLNRSRHVLFVFSRDEHGEITPVATTP